MTGNLPGYLLLMGFAGAVAAAQAIFVLVLFSGKGLRDVLRFSTLAQATVPMAVGMFVLVVAFGPDSGPVDLETAPRRIEYGAYFILPWLMPLGMWLAYRRANLLTRRDLYGISAWIGVVVLAFGLWLGVG